MKIKTLGGSNVVYGMDMGQVVTWRGWHELKSLEFKQHSKQLCKNIH